MKLKHEVWEDEEDNSVTWCFAGSLGDSNRRLLSPKAKLIGTFEAESYVEAMTLFHRFMGWEEYVPLEDAGVEPYTDEWLRHNAPGAR